MSAITSPPSSLHSFYPTFLFIFLSQGLTAFSTIQKDRLEARNQALLSILSTVSRKGKDGLKMKRDKRKREVLHLLVGMDCICSRNMSDWTLLYLCCVWYLNWCYHFLSDDWKLPWHHYLDIQMMASLFGLACGKGWWIISYIKSSASAN